MPSCCGGTVDRSPLGGQLSHSDQVQNRPPNPAIPGKDPAVAVHTGTQRSISHPFYRLRLSYTWLCTGKVLRLVVTGTTMGTEGW